MILIFSALTFEEGENFGCSFIISRLYIVREIILSDLLFISDLWGKTDFLINKDDENIG